MFLFLPFVYQGYCNPSDHLAALAGISLPQSLLSAICGEREFALILLSGAGQDQCVTCGTVQTATTTPPAQPSTSVASEGGGVDSPLCAGPGEASPL